MTRPIPLAIISFVLGALAVVMFIAPRYYTIEDALFSNPEYAEQIMLDASVVSGDAAPALAGDSGVAAPASPQLLIRLRNKGNLTVWGKLECRVSGFSVPIVVPVPILPPAMEEPAVYIIPLPGSVLPEGEHWDVRARWSKLYAK